jgi:hypothetical protein
VSAPRTAAGADAELFARTVRAVCLDALAGEGEDRSRPFAPALWRSLGATGAWEVATTGGGDVPEALAVAEVLGDEAVGGPLLQTFLVVTAELDGVGLDGVGIDGIEGVGTGERIVAVGDGDPLVPWAGAADTFAHLDLATATLRAATPANAAVVAEETLAGEPWAEVALSPHGPAVPAGRPLAVANAVGAAYAVGLGGRALQLSLDYTAERRQFGRTLLSHQTVEHRLAQVGAELDVAADLVVAAGRALARGSGVGAAIAAAHAAAARLYATDVACRAGWLGHQLAGGMGFVAGTLLGALSTRAQQLRHQPPPPSTVEAATLAWL